MFRQFGQEPFVGVEVGVFAGDNALSILKKFSKLQLYLVDPYTPYYSTFQRKIIDPIPFQKIAKEQLTSYHNRVKWCFMSSFEASKVIPGDLDFVYIDANHLYHFVKEDLELWYPKVKVGGLLGGHDFSASEQGVVKAVLEFAEVNHLQVVGGHDDWWIRK